MPIPVNKLSIGPYGLLTGGTVHVESVVNGRAFVRDAHGKKAWVDARNLARLVLPREA